jgi:hypothetical protein
MDSELNCPQIEKKVCPKSGIQTVLAGVNYLQCVFFGVDKVFSEQKQTRQQGFRRAPVALP